jgi:hypothetical protein
LFQGFPTVQAKTQNIFSTAWPDLPLLCDSLCEAQDFARLSRSEEQVRTRKIQRRRASQLRAKRKKGALMSDNEEIATADEPVGAVEGAETGVLAGGGQLGQTTDGTKPTTATGTTTKD